MIQIRHKKNSSPTANESHRCSKVNCQRLLTLKHPTSYTNGLCERHFFLMDLPLNTTDDTNDYVTNTSKNEQIQSTKDQYEPLPGDTRVTREIFDGRQWHIFEEDINHETSINNMNRSYLMTKKDTTENLLQFIRLLSNYKTIFDELAIRNPN